MVLILNEYWGFARDVFNPYQILLSLTRYIFINLNNPIIKIIELNFMINENKLGIWMDHSNAHLIEFKQDAVSENIISSRFTPQEKSETLGKSENVMHNKEQHQQKEYYKNISQAIRDYSHVLLFGPTDAKMELFNLLKADHNFENIKIEVKQTDKMTENQQQHFVKDYFTK